MDFLSFNALKFTVTIVRITCINFNGNDSEINASTKDVVVQ